MSTSEPHQNKRLWAAAVTSSSAGLPFITSRATRLTREISNDLQSRVSMA
jgi:hypothetical protein